MTVVSYETEEERRALRTKLAKGATASGIREEDAYIIIDMVQKCKMDAHDAIRKTAETAPQHLRGVIMYEALIHFGDVTTSVAEELQQALTLGVAQAILGGILLDTEAARQKGQSS